MTTHSVHSSSVASDGTAEASPDDGLASDGPSRHPKLPRAAAALAILLASGCTVLPSQSEATQAQMPVQTQVGPIAVEVSGSVGGLTNDGTTRLVTAGVAQSCPGPDSLHPRGMARPSLTIVWNWQENAGPQPTVMISARLFNAGHQVGVAFHRTISPSAAPDVAFEDAIGGVTCALFRKAGYLGDDAPERSGLTSADAHGHQLTPSA